MSESPQNRQASLPSRRIALDREISIQVPAFDSFVTEYSANVSTTGMFIRSDKPLPPETEISVEFKIADDWKLIRGDAKVVWCRYRDEGPHQPAGMGVHFTDLEPQSRRLISWIIEKHIREGGKPFDLDELKGAAPEAMAASGATPPAATGSPGAPTTQAPAEAPPARPARTTRPARARAAQPVRFRLVPLLLAGIVVTAALYGLFWLSERSAQSVANPDLLVDAESAEGETAAGTDGEGSTRAGAEPDSETETEPDGGSSSRPSASGGTPGAVAPAPSGGSSPAATARPAEGTSPEPPAAAGPAPAAPVFLEAARRTVDGWARAWSEQDVDAYLSYYSRNFRPSGGQSVSAWASLRRQRLLAPASIQVSVTAFEATATSATRGRAEFTQSYRSDTYADTVRKVLELVREDGRWKILEEKTAG